MEPSLQSVRGLCILDIDGKRIVSKYYDQHFPTVKDQKVFEANVFKKTSGKSDVDVLVIDGCTVLSRSSVDLYFYVIGSQFENELILSAVLHTLYESVAAVLHKNVDKRSLFDNMDSILLIIDEIVDGGIFLESHPNNIVKRVNVRNEEVPISEQSVSQVFQSAKEQLKWSLLR